MVMIRARRAREEGHQYKFLAVIDGTQECFAALTFGAHRVAHTGGKLVLLFVVEPAQFQHWLGVENIMRAEALEKAQDTLNAFVQRVDEMVNIQVETIIREGRRLEEIVKLIEEDEDIAILVLAAAKEKDNPGPLISTIVGHGARDVSIPVVIVPGHLSYEEIIALT